MECMDSNSQIFFQIRSSHIGALSPDIVKEPYLYPIWLLVFSGSIYENYKKV